MAYILAVSLCKIFQILISYLNDLNDFLKKSLKYSNVSWGSLEYIIITRELPGKQTRNKQWVEKNLS